MNILLILKIVLIITATIAIVTAFATSLFLFVVKKYLCYIDISNKIIMTDGRKTLVFRSSDECEDFLKKQKNPENWKVCIDNN